MDLKRICYSNNDGTYTLYNAKRYFSEFINNRSYKFQYGDGWIVIIENDLICPLDAENIPIREAARPVSDITRLADFIQESLWGYGPLSFDDRKIPWTKIIYNAEEKLKKEKTEKALESGGCFYYDTSNQEDMEIKEKDIHIIQNPACLDPEEIPPTPKSLWKNIWREGDLCCLFADANVGKSALAVQIGCHIAQTKKVLFCDYEMSDHIFFSRYLDNDGRKFIFPKNFFRSKPIPEVFITSNPQKNLLKDLEKVVKENKFEVVIIDNISFLGKDCYRPSNLSSLIYRLKLLQKKYKLSILLLAHTVKRDPSLPITQNDLQGSNRLFNFIDSCFALAKTVHPAAHLYLKQLKARADEIEFGEDNVILLKTSKKDGWFHFEFLDTGSEVSYLRKKTNLLNSELNILISELSNQGLSQRQIANKLEISLSKVNRSLKKLTPETPKHIETN